MSERLAHLRRQHTLLREHLAWLEAEIARETPSPPPPDPSLVKPRAASLNPGSAHAVSTELPHQEIDALVEQYAAEERQRPEDIRRGCFLAFAGTLLALALAIAVIWLAFYR